jgi:transcriptional regulator GlxA family with amidase domain
VARVAAQHLAEQYPAGRPPAKPQLRLGLQEQGGGALAHRLDELATAAGLSVAHYSMLFRRHTGFSPIDFLIRLRVRRACRLLDTTSLPIGEVGERAGYLDPYYFARCFRRVMGCSPRGYRKMTKG